ncbi:uncharacterized protein LOC114884507 [Monodon monoceros]|uniref:uncharacterized protein LOC114884507 n=1 Tax=Monodon monoceros TaxID=40151 RepID=UPI0010F6CDBE|nr:uncharacterized protein LOC114884507 [Monodon monoceros]
MGTRLEHRRELGRESGLPGAQRALCNPLGPEAEGEQRSGVQAPGSLGPSRIQVGTAHCTPSAPPQAPGLSETQEAISEEVAGGSGLCAVAIVSPHHGDRDCHSPPLASLEEGWLHQHKASRGSAGVQGREDSSPVTQQMAGLALQPEAGVPSLDGVKDRWRALADFCRRPGAHGSHLLPSVWGNLGRAGLSPLGLHPVHTQAWGFPPFSGLDPSAGAAGALPKGPPPHVHPQLPLSRHSSLLPGLELSPRPSKLRAAECRPRGWSARVWAFPSPTCGHENSEPEAGSRGGGVGTPGLSGDSGLRDSQRGGGPPIWFSGHQLKPGSESPSALTALRWVPSGPISAVTRPNILQAVHPAQVLRLQPPVWPHAQAGVRRVRGSAVSASASAHSLDGSSSGSHLGPRGHRVTLRRDYFYLQHIYIKKHAQEVKDMPKWQGWGLNPVQTEDSDTRL